MRKPELRIYQTVLERLEVKPEKAVFLDDLGFNLKPAAQMGMHTIKVTQNRMHDGKFMYTLFTSMIVW